MSVAAGSRRWLVVLVVAWLGGCAGPVTMPDHRATPLTWNSMIYAAKDGPIWVEAVGAPFGQPAAAVAPVVAQAMTGAVIGYPTTFTADPARAPRRNFRTVVVFGPAPSLTEDAICAGRPVFAPRPPGQVAIMAAFCNNYRPLTSLRGGTVALGPDDPRFIALMRQTATDMFRMPTEDRGDMFDFFD